MDSEKQNGTGGSSSSKLEDAAELVIISVSDKTGIVEFARSLISAAGGDGVLQLVATGGTAALLKNAGLNVMEVSSLTGVKEMLNGRVKTLHPKLYGGILSRNTEQDKRDLLEHKIQRVRIVVCNLYPFEQVVAAAAGNVFAKGGAKDQKTDSGTWENKIENIDIGGVTLLRAAAKNYERVTVLSTAADYEVVLNEIKSGNDHDTTLKTRQRLAAKAFALTAAYDTCVAEQFALEFAPEDTGIKLRYGLNPHMQPAYITSIGGQKMPFNVLNGAPSYINMLDALNAWQLVRELHLAFDPPVPAAASFKHVSPSGAAVGSVPLSDREKRAYFVEDLPNLSGLACAYARARGADRLSSFGDFIALSDECDEVTAHIISREVSDGVIAPSYSPEALKMLRAKKNGSYLVLSIDPNYAPSRTSSARLESRDVFGVQLKQAANTHDITFKVFQEASVVAVAGGGDSKQVIDQNTLRDLIVATVACKYAQSNSVVFACNGQVVGVGAGQQSRIHCVRLAGDKVRNWWLRQHPTTLALKFASGVKRAEKSNLIDAFVRREIGLELPREQWNKCIEGGESVSGAGLNEQDAKQWIATELKGVVLSSDAFFPFRDCVDYAAKMLNVKVIVSPGGSTNDGEIIEAAKENGVTLIHTGLRLFHH